MEAASDLPGLFATLESLSRMVKDAGLNLDDIQALAVVRDAGLATATDVSHALGISRPTATRVMRRLVESGLVRESIDAADLRKCNYRVSNRGTNVLYEANKKTAPLAFARQLDLFMALRKAKGAAAEQAGCAISDTEQRILLVLRECGTAMAVRDVRAAAHLAQPKASMAAKRLMQLGWLAQSAPSADAREHPFALSDQGKRIAETMIQSMTSSAGQTRDT